MADELELAADELLGPRALGRDNMFSPVALPSGLDARDYRRFSQIALDDDIARDKRLSSSLKDRVGQEKNFRELEAFNAENDALQELNDLDSFDPDFEEKLQLFSPLATYSDAVSNMMALKRSKAGDNRKLLQTAASGMGSAGYNPRQIDEGIDRVQMLLRTQGAGSPLLAKRMANLQREVGEESFRKQSVLSTSTRREDAAVARRARELEGIVNDEQSLINKFQEEFSNTAGVPSLRSVADLVNFVKDAPIERVELTADNIDDYIHGLDKDDYNAVKNQDQKISKDVRKDPNKNLLRDVILGAGIAKLIPEGIEIDGQFQEEEGWEKKREDVLNLATRSDEASFLTNDIIFNATQPTRPEPKADDTFDDVELEYGNHWQGKDESRSEIELSEAGKNYVNNRRNAFANLHKQIKNAKNIRSRILTMYHKNNAGRQRLKELLDAVETSSNINIDGSDQDPEAEAYYDDNTSAWNKVDKGDSVNR